MHPESTNLLPEEHQRRFRLRYFARICVVFLTHISIVILISAVMLYPTHYYLTHEYAIQEKNLATLTEGATADEMAYEAQLSALQAKTDRVKQLATQESASTMLSQVLDVARTGTTLSGFTINPGALTLTLVGRADTRDHLRAYQLALSQASFVKSANLPVSAYAKDTDIDFIITLAFKTQP